MRISLWSGAALAAACLAPSCQSAATSQVIVYRELGPHAFENGEMLRLRRIEPVDSPQVTAGLWAIRTQDDWTRSFQAEGIKSPPEVPSGVNLGRDMILWAKGTQGSSTRIHIDRAVKNGGIVHVYVTDTTLGSGCSKVEDDATTPVDMVTTFREEGEVHFHVATERNECGDGPKAVASCAIKGKNAPLSAVEIGDTVECESSKTSSPSGRGILDRNWYATFPPGSASRLTYGAGRSTMSFAVDVYGAYAIQFEAVDDQFRKATTPIQVQVAPPKDALALELKWTEFTPQEDPSTFPRLELQTAEVLTKRPAHEATTCSSASTVRPLWCKTARIESVSQMQVFIEPAVDYAVRVRYVDDRYDKMAVACVLVYLNGKKLGETCDPRPRTAGAVWNIGRFVAKTKQFDGVTAPASDKP